ncbi:MAG TPA: protein TolQ [Nitrospiraceae bacterium]|nr:protein TolQ [Nitrospiraceae bacterium]
MHGDTILSLILQAGLVVKGVLIILLFFSIFSWAIIFYKFRLLSKVERESEEFQKVFSRSKSPQGLYLSIRGFTLSPMANLFRAAFTAEKTFVDRDELRRILKKVEDLEATRLEKHLIFLATTATTTPFIGLFGTVWGIMTAFMGIGAAGAASLAVVAPGIAEALIVTAAGLAAAIPAVVAYNYYLSKTRRIIISMENFSQELTDYFVRSYGEEKASSLRD